MRNKIHGFHLDALRLCFEVKDENLLKAISAVKIGNTFNREGFYLQRIEGRHFEYVFEIFIGAEKVLFGELRFGLNRNEDEANTHVNGSRKAWISVANRVLYETDKLRMLSLISGRLGLVLHNITVLDIALDMTINISAKLKRHIRCKENTVILNGKRITERVEDRPEIAYTNSGDLDRDKYRTVNIKQKNAIKDKSKGMTLIAYDKEAEIRLVSHKWHILQAYGNPKHCYRLEVHLNNEDIKDYVKGKEVTLWRLIFDKRVQLDLFLNTVNSIIKFKRDGRSIDWLPIPKGFLKSITSPPRGETENTAKQ